jgi:hypothetical protein
MLRIETLTAAIALVRQLFPDVTRDAGSDGTMDHLPRPLAELYRELGEAIGRPLQVNPVSKRGQRSTGFPRTTHFLHTQDALFVPKGLKQDEQGRWIIAAENQYSWDWRVASVTEDTPVLSTCADEELAELREVNASLNEFLQGFLLREAVFGSRFRWVTDSFEGTLEPIKLGCRVVSTDSNFYFSERGRVLINHESGSWWFGSNLEDPGARLGLT